MVKRLVPLCALVLAACTAAPAREAGPDRTRPTIVSLNPCTDAILAEVADPGQILAISAYSQDPASSSMDVATARRWRGIAGTVEEVTALHPDLVVGSTFMSPATVSALERMGFRLERVGIASDVDQSTAQIRRLAALAGHPERGERLAGRIEAALAAAAPPPGPPVSAVVWQSGGIVAGKGSLISHLLERTGFANSAAALGLGQADYLPLETMLAHPPRMILATGDGWSNEDRLLAHPALARLRDTRRVPFDPALVWCGGPTIERAVRRLAEIRRGA